MSEDSEEGCSDYSDDDYYSEEYSGEDNSLDDFENREEYNLGVKAGHRRIVEELFDRTSERIYLLDEDHKVTLPWLRRLSRRILIPEFFVCAVIDPTLWPKVADLMKDYPVTLEKMLNSENVPEGIKEQLSGNFNYKDSFQSFQDSLPEELIIEILSNLNPYELKDMVKVSKQFENVLSRKDTLDRISSHWNLPRASSLSNLADVWKVSYVTDEHQKYFFPIEVLLHYLMKKDEENFIKVLKNVKAVSFGVILPKFIVLALILKQRKLYFHILEKYKEGYESYRWSAEILNVLVREEYYDEEFVAEVFSGIHYHYKDSEGSRLGDYLRVNKNSIPSNTYSFLFEISQNILAGKKSRRIPQKKFRKCIYPAEHILIRRTVEELQEEIDRLRWK